jgi:DNA-binding transcriptional LysR family regulator
MLNLNDVYLFVQVADHGGFAPAARVTGTPKSTLAKRIAALEAHLGVRLIQRSSRRFVVTDVGREFHRHAVAMLIEAEGAENAVRERLAEPSGFVRITASIPTAQVALAAPLLELARRYPKLHVAVQAADRFVDILQEGIDIAVRDHFAPLPDSGLIQRTVCVDPVYLVAAPAYLDSRGTPSAPAELALHDGLPVQPQAPAWRLDDGAGNVVEVPPRPRFSANESSLLLAAAIDGLGIACLPRKLCGDALAAGRLVRVLPGWTAGQVTTTLLIPHRRGQLPSVRAVADVLVERIPRAGVS